MDISQFAASLLPQAESLLREWFPAGRMAGGHEFQIGSLAGEEGHSLSVNTRTGVWKDFATGEDGPGGGDLLSLYAAREGLKQGEAAKALGWINGGGHAVIAAPAKPAPEPPEKPPADAPVPAGTAYAYRDMAGELLFYIQRTEATETERKSFRPLTWRNGRWSAKGYPAPRPLFGLETLQPGRRVLLVEGEKACLAARQLLPMYTVMTWAGGAAAVKQADWTALYGHDVDLWPDADAPGAAAMALVGGLLAPHCEKVRVLLQDGMPEGWDLADALADGWDTARVVEHVKAHGSKSISLQVGSPKQGKPPIEQEPIEGEARSVYAQYEQLGLSRNSGGIVYANEANAMQVLLGHEQFAGKIWLNEFSLRLMIGERLFDDRDAISALIYMQQALQLHKMTLTAVKRAAVMAGYANARHPLKLWLTGLVWDGVPRLATFMADAFGCRQDDYTAAIGRCWLISMIARVNEPGCVAQYMMVFQGAQGIQKSTALNAIVGDEWFLESHYDPIKQRVDFLGSLQGKWLIEIPEMHKIGGRYDAIEEIKGMITCRFDHFREPYGTTSRDYPRQCILSGSTNRDTWNPDPTGGRRFWPAWCGTIDVDYISAQREQLFAEALHVYRSTHIWHDVPIDMAMAEQEGIRERDEWESLVVNYVARLNLPHVTVGDLLQHCLDIPMRDWTQQAQNRVAKALRANGFMRTRLNIQGKREWAYVYSAHVAKAQQLDADF